MAQVPVEDSSYAQKEARKYALPGGRHPNDVRDLAQTPDGLIWVATASGLYTWRDTWFERLPDEWIGGSDTKALAVDDVGRLWVATCLNVAVRDPEDGQWSTRVGEATDTGFGAIIGVAVHQGRVVVATRKGPGLLEAGQFTSLADLYPPGARLIRLQFNVDGDLWLLGGKGAVLADLKAQTWKAHLLPDTQVRALAETSTGELYFATSDGLVHYPQIDAAGVPMTTPVRDLHDIKIAPNGALVIASSRGVCQYQGNQWAYFNGPRWLPRNDARTVLCAEDDTVYVGTASGCARLTNRPFTLAEKYDSFEQRVRDRHLRLTGFVNNVRLSRPGDLATAEPRPSDNDGLWTGLYLAAQSYRYATTGDEQARTFARQAFLAMEWLEAVTTVPGFPTKAIVSADEDMSGSNIPWYPSADGKWLWKGDCSSDEIDGHMYGYSIYYDLAADDAEKDRVRTLVARIMDHILDHGYFIVGPDGERTRWGVWAPSYLNGPWRAQCGLNSLEILSALRTAHHITGEARYELAYRDLIDTHGYAENARRQKIDLPGHINHSDDELAFISYYPLIKYETDDALRGIYLDSLQHAWQIERPERNPLWNFIHGALTQQPHDIEEAVRTLREIPMDLVNWPVENSHRLDIALDAERGRFGELQSAEVLPYSELPISKWNGNPYRVDNPTDGTDEDDGTYYVLPYWMGRYYGYIE